MRPVFLTFTDRQFFPGAVATISSVVAFHPDAEFAVAFDDRNGLTPAQLRLFKPLPNIRLLPASEIAAGRHVAAWKRKAHVSSALAVAGYETIVGIDSGGLLVKAAWTESSGCFSKRMSRDTDSKLHGPALTGRTVDEANRPMTKNVYNFP